MKQCEKVEVQKAIPSGVDIRTTVSPKVVCDGDADSPAEFSALSLIFDKLGSVRSGLMGIAMIAVVLYHMYCWIKPYPILKAFRFGYIGVDVFLLISGFGISYSYNRHSLMTFYARRLHRIFPLCVLERLMVLCLVVIFGIRPFRRAIIDFVLNASTLSYWVPIGNHGDWFIPAIIFLYLLFPLFYWFILRLKMNGVLFFVVCGLLFSHWYASNVGWYYDCLIARIPAFSLGIFAYFAVQYGWRITAFDSLCWTVVSILAFSFGTSNFFQTTMIAPYFILAVFPALAVPGVRKILDFVGEHSFELFLGHAFGCKVAGYMGLWRKCSHGMDVILFLIVSAIGFAVFYFARKTKAFR